MNSPLAQRIAFVSDIHGNLHALRAVMADIQRRQITTVANLGDTLSGPLLSQETATLLRQLDWLHVAGNHERQVLTLPLERQNLSDAFTSAAIDNGSRAWEALQNPRRARRGFCGMRREARNPRQAWTACLNSQRSASPAKPRPARVRPKTGV